MSHPLLCFPSGHHGSSLCSRSRSFPPLKGVGGCCSFLFNNSFVSEINNQLPAQPLPIVCAGLRPPPVPYSRAKPTLKPKLYALPATFRQLADRYLLAGWRWRPLRPAMLTLAEGGTPSPVLPACRQKRLHIPKPTLPYFGLLPVWFFSISKGRRNQIVSKKQSKLAGFHSNPGSPVKELRHKHFLTHRPSFIPFLLARPAIAC